MISKEEVKHIAKLARLELSEEEIVKMQKDLSSILDYFEILKKAKSSSQKEVIGEKLANATRQDFALEKDSKLVNNLIAAAPDKKDSYIKVKSVLHG